jgi:hypothetical protein
MNQSQLNVDDSACPSALVIFPALIGTLVWVCALLARIPQY